MSPNNLSQLNCRNCTYRSDTQWEALTETETILLSEAVFCMEYEPGEVLFHEGDTCKGVYCIRSGLVVVRKSGKDDDYVLLRRLGQPGTTLGYRPFLADDCHRGTAEAVKPSIICHIDRATLTPLLNSNPKLGLLFLKQAAIDLGQAEEEILEPMISARARLAHAIILFKERNGKLSSDGKLEIQLPLSRDDLAAMACVHPETVTKIFRAFKKEGVAELVSHTLKITSIDRFFDELGEEFI
jgi:CRP/FNR family transcriptional regulator